MYDGLQSPGRNDECWCGSGKKYKTCHGAPCCSGISGCFQPAAGQANETG